MKPKRKRIIHWGAPEESEINWEELEEIQAYEAQHPRPLLSEEESKAEHRVWMEQQLLKTPSIEGWMRLNDLLIEALQDKRVQSSAGAIEFALDCQQLAQNGVMRTVFYGDDVDAIDVFKALMPDIAADQLGPHKGWIEGGETMKRLKAAHTKHLTTAVVDILKNPKTSDWKDPDIARWLMEPGKAYHERKGKTPLGLKTMTNRVKEIRAAYKASI
jgi:hypothetical protein